MELGIFLLQLPELQKSGVGVRPLRQKDLVGQYRLQHRRRPGPLKAQAVAGAGLGQSGDRHHAAGLGAVHGAELGARIQAQLVRLLLPGVFAAPQHFLGPQGAAGDLQVGQAVALAVPGDLEDTGAKFTAVIRDGGEALQALHQLLHALQLQGRAEKAGKELPLSHHLPDQTIRQRSGLKILLNSRLIAGGSFFIKGIFRCAKIHAARTQALLQTLHHLRAVCPRQVHFVDKQNGGHGVPLQQLPQGPGVTLDAVGTADDQHRAVQHPQRPLCLCGKIHMARGIQQRHLSISQGKYRLLGKDGDAPLPFNGIRIQKSVGMVHPAKLANGAAAVKQGLGKGGLTRVHVGQDA